MIDVLKKINFLLTKRQREGLVLLSFLLFFGMILEVFGLGILVPALNVIIDPQALDTNSLISNIKDFFPQLSNSDFTFNFLIFIVLIYFVKSLFLVFLVFKQNKFLTNYTAYITNALFSSYLSQPYSFHLKKNTSELIKNIQIEISGFSAFLLALITIFIEGGFVLSILCTLIYIEPFGALSIGIFYGLLSLIFLKFTKKKLNQWGILREEIDAKVSKTALEGLGGIKDLLILGKTRFFINRFGEQNYFKARLNANHNTISQIPRFYLELISIIGLVSFIIMQLFQGKDSSSLITILGVFVAATFRMIPSLNRIISAIQSMKFFKNSVDIIFNEIKLNSRPLEFLDSQQNSIFQKKIQFTDVSFWYNKNSDILKDINLEIKKGETIGIIGESGSGKSTFVDLLIGLHKQNSGDILIDGVNDCQLKQSWRNIIGYVSQTIYLTDDSIKNNIAFGVSENQINEERITALLEIVQLKKFVNNLELGFNTKVGDRGVQLSGGQRQRIGIARALYNDPDILILDEATASLDTDTETKVMESIYGLKGEKTIIIIAHRLSTLEICDTVYEIKDQFLKLKKDL
ncbi:ABC transporter ATP-binding protein/permease [Flavobacteriaceae bacterium]|nr:ABC transporter ATP-binding protein/permease [Flavobacteriaceae bacterium]